MNKAKSITNSINRVLHESANVFLDYSGDSLVLEFDTDFNLKTVEKSMENILSNFKVTKRGKKLYLAEPEGDQVSHRDYELIKKNLEKLNLWVS